MKKLTVAICLVVLVFLGCSQQSQEFNLIEGTPAFELARELSAILPALDPELNTVLVSTKQFKLSSDEVIQAILENMGNQADQLKQVDAEQLKSILAQNAERLAERKLLVRAAVKKNVQLSPDAVDNALSEQYLRAGGEEQFLQMLEQSGMVLENVKASIESDLLIQTYLEYLLKELTEVNEQEIQEAYQEDKTASVRHILLLTQGKSETEKTEIHKQMEGILERARKGEDFSELAKQYTEDPGSKDNGGLYEDFGRGRMVPPFEEAAFTVPVGEISDIVETTYGYHILKIEDRKKETRPLEEIRAELEADLRQRKEGTAFQDHLNILKQESGFEVHSL
jgi:parvulin-like peptidyl-prolyl isomerase